MGKLRILVLALLFVFARMSAAVSFVNRLELFLDQMPAYPVVIGVGPSLGIHSALGGSFLLNELRLSPSLAYAMNGDQTGLFLEVEEKLRLRTFIPVYLSGGVEYVLPFSLSEEAGSIRRFKYELRPGLFWASSSRDLLFDAYLFVYRARYRGRSHEQDHGFFGSGLGLDFRLDRFGIEMRMGPADGLDYGGIRAFSGFSFYL